MQLEDLGAKNVSFSIEILINFIVLISLIEKFKDKFNNLRCIYTYIQILIHTYIKKYSYIYIYGHVCIPAIKLFMTVISWKLHQEKWANRRADLFRYF